MVRNFIDSIAERQKLYNSLLNLFASLVTNVINILIIGIIINEFGESEYGKYAFVYITVTLIGYTLGLSTGIVGSNIVAAKSKKGFLEIYQLGTQTVTFSLFLGFFITIGFWIGAFPTLGLNIFVVIFFVLLAIVLASLDSFLKSILIGLKRVNVFFICVIVSSLINISLLFFLKNHFGLYVALLTFILGLSASVIISLITLKFRFNRILNQKSKKFLFSFQLNRDALLNLISSVLFPSVLWLCYKLLRNYAGNIAVAEFNLAYQCFILVTFIPITTNRILVPYIIQAKNESARLSIIKKAVLLNLITSIPFFVVLHFFGPDFFRLISSKISVDQLIISLISLAAVFSNLSSPIGIYIISKSDFTGALKLNAFSMALLLVLVLILIPKNQTLGVTIAFLIVYILHLLVSYFYVKKSYF